MGSASTYWRDIHFCKIYSVNGDDFGTRVHAESFHEGRARHFRRLFLFKSECDDEWGLFALYYMAMMRNKLYWSC